MSIAQRKFVGEIAALIDKSVRVITKDGKEYSGILAGIHPETLNLCLSDAKDMDGQPLHRIVLNGSNVSQLFTIGKPFDLKALSERLDKVFPTLVRLYEDQGIIWVMDKIKVTAKGIVEGTGPAADRVQKVYDLFLKESQPK